jgi:alpha-tubulin suppressor-like RCC1 family protein
MKTSNRSVIFIAALFLLALLAGCGSSSSSNSVPTVEQAFYAHSVVFANNSTLLTAGYNEFGQLGNTTLTSPFAFVGSPVNLGRVQGYAAGANHTLAFGNNSTIWAWGSNLHGRLGINRNKDYYNTPTSGNDAYTKIPLSFHTPNSVVSLATGWNHSLAVAGPNRSVLAWGSNSFGQLGNNGNNDEGGKKFEDQRFGVAVLGAGGVGTLDNIVQVAAGGSHSLALSKNGRVYAWGDNQFGQLGRQTFPVAFGPVPEQVAFPAEATGTVVAIAAAGSFSAALMDDGTIWEWGYNVYGQCGTKPEVTTTGGVSTTQYLFEPRQVKYADGTPFLASKISLGTMHTIALSTTGELWAWGWNEKAQLGISTPGHNSNTLMEFEPRKVFALGGLPGGPVTDIYAFGTVSFARINGKWYGWGDNGFGQLGQLIPTNVIPIIYTPVEFKPAGGA